MIIASLFRERLFFDYATNYHSRNDSIIQEFIFSDDDFREFSEYLSDKEYTYKTETEKTIEKLKQDAEKEDYFSELSDQYTLLADKMQQNKKDDLERNKDDIIEILTAEIMSRYYYQKGRIRAGLNFDDEVEKAVEVLQDSEQYNNILKSVK